MRTIKFRGKYIETGEWVYGYLFSITTEQGNKGFFIIVENTSETDESIPDNSICFEHGKDCFYINPETICQFTGLHDKNGKEIYEGDIISLNPRNYKTLKVYWNDRMCNFLLVNDDTVIDMYKDDENHYKVIGNIHDNPELMKGGEVW